MNFTITGNIIIDSLLTFFILWFGLSLAWDIVIKKKTFNEAFQNLYNRKPKEVKQTQDNMQPIGILKK
jgi:hypothetical protein